jgi:hypothetical protein
MQHNRLHCRPLPEDENQRMRHFPVVGCPRGGPRDLASAIRIAVVHELGVVAIDSPAVPILAVGNGDDALKSSEILG